ncbi:TonB-dependent receptor domain-containing protein [Novosphingopyxis sp. YJ-S2-01]|uniref:TonB-dependent receptor domain-containing protein n=1 Tax=Novosphingopyxis sp. YJ-S2-01 TaxID=2794021 RepID=UPI0018DD49ED|nr:TonB-dependent receptor [Novosphingopyxis sp. YJ-S2-01]MBH9538034.1 TonB-dependent receptor [Novosphingopyxis sp. YJ-S2-01]
MAANEPARKWVPPSKACGRYVTAIDKQFATTATQVAEKRQSGFVETAIIQGREFMRTSRFLFAASISGIACSMLLPASLHAQITNDEDERVESEVDAIVPDSSTAQQTDNGLIVVTGSRIARSANLEGPIPVTAIDAETLTRGSDIALGDALNELPALRSTFSTSNSGRFIGTAGLSLLDLRGLGTTRTLVLVNGRRHVTSTPGDFNVDVNTIPSELLERVEVITGGSSAVYGSDAVAGVVNFILRDDFDGLRIKGQGGISDEGDRGSYSVSGTIGKNFFDNRLNIALSGEYSQQNPLFFTDRPDQFGAFAGTPGFVTTDPTVTINPDGSVTPEPPAGDGIPDTSFVGGNGRPGVKFGFISGGGALSTSCPAPRFDRRVTDTCSGQLDQQGFNIPVRYFFQPDGSLVRNTGNYTLTGGSIGGLGATGIEGGLANVGLKRYSGNILVNADISPAFQPFLEAKYVHVDSFQASPQATFFNSRLNSVFNTNNPFLTPQAIATINSITGRPGGGTPQFVIQRFNYDIGTRGEDHDRDTYRVVAGIRGSLSDVGNLRYEAAFNYGHTDTFYRTSGNILIANFNNALAAVRAPDGSIQCRINVDSNPANDDPACAPLNLFGAGNPSQAAQDYVLYESTRDETADQYNVTAFISGDSSGLFELPGGPVGFAVGGEYRREEAFSSFDDLTNAGATFLNSNTPFDPPALEVYEAYGELNVPIISGVSGIEELTASGAVRYSDYNFSGGVTAYNANLIYSPFPGLRFRGGYARSVRAPNLGNLFATQSETFNTIADPCNATRIGEQPNFAARCAEAGIPTTITLPNGNVIPFTNVSPSNISGFNRGNPNLRPEKSNSFTFGGVFAPTFLPGFSITLDYYNIEVEDVISGLSAQAIVDRCYNDPNSLDNPFCAVVFRRAPTGNVFQDYAFDGQQGRRFPGLADETFPAVGPGFINQPFNFASLKTSGIDADISYRKNLGANASLAIRGLVSWVAERNSFSFIGDPDRYVRLKSTLGDPEWAGNLSVALEVDNVTLTYEGRYVGKQTIAAFETQNSVQGRPPENADAFPQIYYPDIYYNDIRLSFNVQEKYDFYVGVDNVLDQLPPFGIDGTGGGGAIYDNTGRFFYAGFVANF